MLDMIEKRAAAIERFTLHAAGLAPAPATAEGRDRETIRSRERWSAGLKKQARRVRRFRRDRPLRSYRTKIRGQRQCRRDRSKRRPGQLDRRTDRAVIAGERIRFWVRRGLRQIRRSIAGR